MAPSEQRQVEVKFTTSLPPPFKVSPSPFSLPSSLSRYGLSEVINTLLASEIPQPFDFLIGGEILRTSLEIFLLAKNISVESVVHVEYLQAVLPPRTAPSLPHPDWIRAVHGSIPGVVVTGSYDTFGRVLVDGKECKCVLSGHKEVVTSVTSFNNDGENVTVVTASKDRSLRLWHVPISENGLKKEIKVEANKIFKGHSSAVQAVTASPSGEQICSGSWDGTICLWRSTEEGEGGGEGEEGEKGGIKKRKLSRNESVASGPIEISSKTVLEGHSQCVSDLVWIEKSKIFSCSWDHTIRCWDSATGINTLTLTGTKPVLCISGGRDGEGEGEGEGGGTGLVASGGGDSVLRLWDTRTSSSVTPVKQFTSHKGWISSVKWHPQSSYHLISSSYDGTVKLWDTRSVIPLYTMDTKSEKVLAADWWGPGTIISGGTDSTLSIHEGVHLN